jgi:putative DNA primase/helicase
VSAARVEAAAYYRRGLAPIPTKPGTKEPDLLELAPYLERRATGEELRTWTWRGVGIVTGPVSGVLVLDADGPEGRGELEKYGHPPTPMVRTPGGGLHLYFRHPDLEVKTGIRVAPGLDVKATGGYVVAPPTVGANDKPYEWLISPDDTEFAEPPAWLLHLLKRRQRNGTAPQVGEKIPSGQRNKQLTSIAGTMRRRGMGEAEILAALRVANEGRCEPPLEAAEVEGIARSVARYEPASETAGGDVVQVSFNGRGGQAGQPSFNLTDLGNSGRLVHRYGPDLRFCWAWGKWLAYDGRRYAIDDTGEVYRLAADTVASIYAEAAAAPDQERRKALGKHAERSEAGSRIREMVDLARSKVPVRQEALDADRYLLNVLNGTVDLRSGELREHRREDLITKLAPVEYDPNAAAPTWAATLERALPSEELRRFFKKLVGYALTGDISEHVLPVLYGTGANGKSTILNALLAAVGDYGMQAAPDLLVAKKGAHPTEIADLFGMRFVASIEVEDGRRLAESLVKQLTGGDKVRARRMRQDFWQFDPTHKVFMAVNHKPEIRGTDTAIWRRLRLIPFTETIPAAEQDKKLPEKLEAELPGILAWAVEGCLEWMREGLQAPAEVRRATGQYRSEMDVIGAFLQDECEIGKGLKEPFTSLYKRYEEWCEEGGERAETRRQFNARLKERGAFEARRSGPGGANEWHGLRLLKKQNSGFAGKLKERPANTHNRPENTSSRDEGKSSFSSSVTSVDPRLVGEVGEEMRRKGSGARLNLPVYLRGETTLEILARSVLVGLGKDPGEWGRYATAVSEAAGDPQNHTPDCKCEGCL